MTAWPLFESEISACGHRPSRLADLKLDKGTQHETINTTQKGITPATSRQVALSLEADVKHQ
jgi:hypothetical protein